MNNICLTAANRLQPHPRPHPVMGGEVGDAKCKMKDER